MLPTLTRGWALGRSRAATRKTAFGRSLMDWLTGEARRRGERRAAADSLSLHMERDIGLRDIGPQDVGMGDAAWPGRRLYR